MPPSRIAFAFGDMMTEIRRLIPRDEIANVRVLLKGPIYDRVCRELSEYSGDQRFDPATMPVMSFGGISIERDAVADLPGAPEVEETYG